MSRSPQDPAPAKHVHTNHRPGPDVMDTGSMLIGWLLVLSAIGVRGTGQEEGDNDSTVDKPGQRLWKGVQPGEGESHEDKKHAKRQFYLPPPLLYQQPGYSQQPQQAAYPQQPQQAAYPQQPQQAAYPQQPQQTAYPQQAAFPFIPIYIPYRQVVEVHHVVMLQPPTCPPQQPAPRPQTTPESPVFPYPPATQPPFPTMAPELDDRGGPMGGQNATMTGPRRPSRCVWAIVACCSPDSTSIRYSCFELLGCPGAFWGVNPCEPKVVQAAANTALNFYMSGGSDEDVSGNAL